MDLNGLPATGITSFSGDMNSRQPLPGVINIHTLVHPARFLNRRDYHYT
jgi:hypothetical protein